MTPLRYEELPPIHPDAESEPRTVHFPDALVLGSVVTAATWTCLPDGALTVGDSSFVNVVDDEHDAAETRDDTDYDGPLLTVWLSSGTAVDGDTVVLKCTYETDFPLGPTPKEFRILVSRRA